MTRTLPTVDISTKFAVEVFTLGLCTTYTASEIASYHSAAAGHLARTIAELRKFSSLFTNEEFNNHYNTCSILTQQVMDQMEKEARRTGYIVTMKKFNAMVATAQDYDAKCRAEAVKVNRLSTRKAEEKKRDENFKPPGVSDDDLAMRMQRTTELSTTVNMANILAEIDLDLVDAKIRPLVERLEALFRNKDEYRRLLKLTCQTPENAQRLLNMFQRLLDVLELPGTALEQNLIAATQRLAVNSGLYPECYRLTEVVPEADDFEVVRGGFADVRRASFQGQTVCLKFIRLHKNSQKDYLLKKCSNEAIIWGQLSHPNLLPFFGVFHVRVQVAFVAPWMKNGHIIAYLDNHPAANRVLLTLDVAQGLLFLHRKRVIHGDLKGYNILVKDSGRACLADFGISSVSDEHIMSWTSQSSPGSQGGTSRWQAPELFKKSPEDKPIRNTELSDIYAWSCAVFEIFTGELPFHHISRDDVLIKRVCKGGRPRRPPGSSRSWHEWGLTESIWSLMQDCWVADPNKRPTAMKVVQRLMVMSTSEDRRPIERAAPSPARFRESVRAGSIERDELTIDVFESLVRPSTTFANASV